MTQTQRDAAADARRLAEQQETAQDKMARYDAMTPEQRRANSGW